MKKTKKSEVKLQDLLHSLKENGAEIILPSSSAWLNVYLKFGGTRQELMNGAFQKLSFMDIPIYSTNSGGIAGLKEKIKDLYDFM